MNDHQAIPKIMIILYVRNQRISKEFYCKVLKREPLVDVPGMTEFELGENILMGLMPNDGMARILGEKMPHPDTGYGIPRCELYLPVTDPDDGLRKLVEYGGKCISEGSLRNWGHHVAYGADPDEHIIAFAKDNP